MTSLNTDPTAVGVDRNLSFVTLAVICFRIFLGTAFLLSAIVVTLVNAQSTGGEKRKREETRVIASPTPAETPEPTPTSTKRKAKSSKSASSKSKNTATPTVKKTPTPKPAQSPEPKSKTKSGTKESSEKEAEATVETEEASPAKRNESEPTATPAIKKSPTPKAAESSSTKSKAKSGRKKTGEKGKTATSGSKRKKKGGSKKSSGQTKKTEASKTPTPEPDRNRKPETGNRKAKSGESTDGEGTTPASKRVEGGEPAKTPAFIEKLPKSAPEPTRTPVPEPPSQARPVFTPPSPQTVLPSDITIEKSGLEKEQGLEPPPPPPPQRGFWPWSRQPANYRYLTSATIDAIRNAPVQRGRWKYVIVHNSGTRQGNARAFDYYHRKIRRMRNGLAYHFVIGNGTSSRNGQIEIGDRWRRQINGGHVHSDYMNNIGLGICLVGDFNRDQPTRAQLEACEELIKYLQERCGKSDGRSLIVRPHREVNPPRWATDCPGDAFPYNWFGRFR